MVVRPVVVDDQVQVESCWCLNVDLLEESNELLMAMARHAVTDHMSVEHAECCEQGRCPVALVVVRHSAAPPFLQWQPGLRAVERLDLRLLVYAEDECAIRRIEIQADDVVQLVRKGFVATELE